MAKTKIDYDLVAELSCRAYREGLSASALIAHHIHVSHKYACQLIMRARRRGYDIPPLPTQVVSKISLLWLRCSSCEDMFAVHNVDLLKKHTLVSHSRAPLREELVPK